MAKRNISMIHPKVGACRGSMLLLLQPTLYQICLTTKSSQLNDTQIFLGFSIWMLIKNCTFINFTTYISYLQYTTRVILYFFLLSKSLTIHSGLGYIIFYLAILIYTSFILPQNDILHTYSLLSFLTCKMGI